MDFHAIQQLVDVQADHIFGWTGCYTVVYQQIPHKFVSLIHISKNKIKIIVIRIESKITNDMHP